jgi:biopolymer transport protein ExbB
MKKIVNVLVIGLCFIVCALFYHFYMGNPANFLDAAKHEPINVIGMIHTGGPVVAFLLTFILVAIVYSIERTLSINKARGKDDPVAFARRIIALVERDDLEAALAECDRQRGSVANVLRAGITRFQTVQDDKQFSAERKMAEFQRSIDEALNLEVPLLEKNLVILSTIGTIATLMGLFGTTLGMIRAFQALAETGTASAIQLSIAISEALYCTAGGLLGAMIGIVAYNFFTTKVDAFVYLIDEAILNVSQIFTGKVEK